MVCLGCLRALCCLWCKKAGQSPCRRLLPMLTEALPYVISKTQPDEDIKHLSPLSTQPPADRHEILSPSIHHSNITTMPEVRRGSRHASDPIVPTFQNGVARSATFPAASALPQRHESDTTANGSKPRHSMNTPRPKARHTTSDSNRRKSLAYQERPEAEAYYDSRAATQHEYRRRAKTLKEYYQEHPNLLPQLPFTFHHGKKRWRLAWLLFFMFVDACAVPIALYYGMHYSGHVEGWIIFAIVTTIWGGPAYLEFAIRTLRLIKKESFYRPLGTTSRWAADITTWTSSVSITVVTALFIIGSAPHIVWLRVLCMPAPALLYCIGGCVTLMQLYHEMGWKAPFRVSSTPKGEPLNSAAYYFMEDVMAVNAGAGRPYREALEARYFASARFRRLLRYESWFWGIPPIIVAIPLTIIATIDPVPPTAAYGICKFVFCNCMSQRSLTGLRLGYPLPLHRHMGPRHNAARKEGDTPRARGVGE